jgi:hypothetical protein
MLKLHETLSHALFQAFVLYRGKAMAPVVYLVEGIYEKGVKVLADELANYLPFWQRSETLHKWDITILPN